MTYAEWNEEGEKIQEKLNRIHPKLMDALYGLMKSFREGDQKAVLENGETIDRLQPEFDRLMKKIQDHMKTMPPK